MPFHLEQQGYCPICEAPARFVSNEVWLRDYFKCTTCKSIPRERALMQIISNVAPDWKTSTVHESSPGARGVSSRLKHECANYIPSQFYEKVAPGETYKGCRSENLEQLTFDDESIDLHVTQDVMEHVFQPERAFSEIARTLAPGGKHIFTVPLVNKFSPSCVRASIDDRGEVVHHKEPSYHGNPIGDGKSLVTFDWGFDITEFIFRSSGLFTHTYIIDNIENGIRAEYIEVLVSIKPLSQ